MLKPLSGRVAVVAGATRGAGRGIARMLGEAGATVYCTGRSSRTRPNTSDHSSAGRPETIEETAEMVTADGGTGIPVRVDHTAGHEVATLFERVDVFGNMIRAEMSDYRREDGGCVTLSTNFFCGPWRTGAGMS